MATPPHQPQLSGEPPTTYFVGRYRVVDELGSGGMATVHLARVDGPGGFQKWVALKRIHPRLVANDRFVDMFLDEARTAAGINHANVAQVFDLGRDDDTYWIAMEYLHGEALREVQRCNEERGVPMPPELAARVCADAADGLHAAHELRGKTGQLLGLVHRDVTPHNLFVTYDGFTKVVDFGIAKVAGRLSSDTLVGSIKGKVAYMSPEHAKGMPVDRTADIFALGVVLWEVTTNRRLFRMDSDLETFEKVQTCQVPPPSTIVGGYPQELEACVMKALAKRPQDRYQTAREVSRALQQYLARAGQYVGTEEVAQYLRGLFAERIKKRDAHLAWAAEVTSTIEMPHAEGVGEEASLPQARARAGEPTAPSSGIKVGTMSLLEDDDDVPTGVATPNVIRSHLILAPRRVTPASGPAPDLSDVTTLPGRRPPFPSSSRVQSRAPEASPPAVAPPAEPRWRPPMPSSSGAPEPAWRPPMPSSPAAFALPVLANPRPPMPSSPAAFAPPVLANPRPPMPSSPVVRTGSVSLPAELSPMRRRRNMIIGLVLATLCLVGLGVVVVWVLF